MSDLLIRGGRVIDPSRGSDGPADVLLRDGKIEAVGRNIPMEQGTSVIDATGKVVAPGLVDLHVHLREPGFEHAETIASGAAAAAAGGFTAVCAMPNTDPVTDSLATVGFVVRQAIRAGQARVYPIGAVSLGQRGEQLTEFGELIQAGAVAVSDDGKPIRSSHLMRTALEYAKNFGIPVADHCEDTSLAQGGAMHEGIVSARLGLKGIPAAAEEIMVARNIILAELTGGHVHLCHMSTRGSVELIRWAKSKGLRVTAEATPHHFTLTQERCEGYNTNAKMNPPLREAADRDAIRQGLADGTIDCIASDHAPHHYDAKEREFDEAPNGIVGLETALGLALRELVEPGLLSLADLVARMSTIPARIFHLPGGTLAVGAPGDVVVFDPERRWEVRREALHSKSMNTPFLGETLRGQADVTVVGGRVVFQRPGRPTS
ncbi:MAG TPA: dihydroorotase [Gemmatimonadales bacterium]|jgi:dihydroorotase|nr:dihydroorotase [Gemmatimonadales bacterium]